MAKVESAASTRGALLPAQELEKPASIPIVHAKLSRGGSAIIDPALWAARELVSRLRRRALKEGLTDVSPGAA